MEPGCYFIKALLVPAMENAKTSKFFNRETIERFKNIGGVRIESDLVIMLIHYNVLKPSQVQVQVQVYVHNNNVLLSL